MLRKFLGQQQKFALEMRLNAEAAACVPGKTFRNQMSLGMNSTKVKTILFLFQAFVAP